ncbi:MAG: sulfurtransferase/chromate resistance protein [Acidiferrobacterales bacterium]|nr:sulfurtransferase/chromate resistance protein [Acidiferrobacterales bacterium]
MPSPTEITSSQLSRLIGTPNSPTIIDVRIAEDIHADPQLIPTARRHAFNDMDTLAPELVDQKVVVYCQKGKKISQGAAAVLRYHGIQTECLAGGHFDWRDAGLPLVPIDAIPDKNSRGQTVWVTRQRPKIDRIACPWLIRRFVDPQARFLFVAPSEVVAVAEKFDATPFDMEDQFWSHRGEGCTFDTMLEEFQLFTPPLNQLAEIVRGADTGKLQLTPQSAGLLSISLGLSRMYRDDLTQLEASIGIYDALYRWCRDATDESHVWPHGKG